MIAAALMTMMMNLLQTHANHAFFAGCACKASCFKARLKSLNET
jgi:hypothetical protein